MTRIRHFAVAAAAGAFLVSCTSSTAASGTTGLERSWLQQLSAGKRAQIAVSTVAATFASRIVSDLRGADASSIRVTIYLVTTSSPRSLAPDIHVETTNSGWFLRHRLGRVLPLVNRHAYVYISVSDRRGVAFEWDQHPRGGALRVRTSIAGCSPVHNLGPSPPPCPVP